MTRRSLLLSSLSAAPRRPNIVWIWADNLAWQDLSIYGSTRVRTPNIDALARSGVRFTQYYVAHTVCSPSRAALLTGRQPFRAGVVDVLRPDSPAGLPADEITLASALRPHGYATQAIGKWHLGDRREFLPTRRGFDHYFGMPYSMDMLPAVLLQDERIIDDLGGDNVQNVTIRYTDEAIRFVRASRARPFFLYFSHTIPHPPLNLPANLRTPGRPIYDDAIEHMDAEVGRLLKELPEDTLVFFSSDNGPMGQGGQTGPLRGGIRDSYEGGIRVPMIARWPGHIPAGSVVNSPTIAYDIFPTILNAAGASLPADRVYDGQDITPLLTGAGEIERRQPFYWVYHDRVTTIRDGRYKLHVVSRETPLSRPELYDVEADPAEANPLSDQATITRLKAKINAFEATIPKVWRLEYPVRDPAKLKSGIRKK